MMEVGMCPKGEEQEGEQEQNKRVVDEDVEENK
jgi:hypothetical protein